jgi:hypothetical protein
MKKRQTKPDERIFVFKVYQWVAGKNSPYRILAIPEEFTLYDFAYVITDSFDFDFDHPFGFYNHLTRYNDATEAYESFYDDPKTRYECPSFVKGVKTTPMNTVFNEIGKQMLFFFDYGDNWKFRVELLRIEPAEPGKKYPECVQSVKKARQQYPDEDWDEDE